MSEHTPLLAVRNIEVVYHDVVLVLRGISLDVPRGEITAVLGANGAGKTTLLRAVTGLLGIHRGKIPRGTIEFDGEPITDEGAAGIVRRGIAQVMEHRRIFASLSVEENLRAGAHTRRDRSDIQDGIEKAFEMFPILRERRRAIAGYLSGGEQQMLAIGRALMAAPRLLVLDEPSLGLAPRVVQQIREVIADINRAGMSVLLVEQNATMALSIADRGYVMENGKIVKEGTAEALREDRDIQEFYLGVGHAGRRSFRDVKSYRRKKGWGG